MIRDRFTVMHKIKTGNFQIAYRRQGSGPALVLLHGGLADSRQWSRQLEELSDEFTVIAWDAPGCGESSDPPEHFSLSDYADCLADFIKKLGLQKPHILGLSFGGGLAIEFYNRYPDIPRSLVLASAYAGWAGSLSPEEVEIRRKNGVQQSNMAPEKVVEKWLPTLFTDSVPIEAVEETASMMADFHPVGMRAMLRAFAEADLRDVLPKISVPTLLLYGDEDQRSPLHVGRALHKKIPASEFIVMPGVGHVSNIEAPDIFNQEVRSFLSSN